MCEREPPELHYTTLCEADVPVCTEIARAAFDEDTRLHTDKEHDGPPGYDDGTLLRRMCTASGWISRVIWLGGQTIGAYSVRISGSEGELLYFFLNPAVAGRGIGTAVWQDIERTFVQVRRWMTDTPDYSVRNRYFYTVKCGFHEIGLRRYGEEASVLFAKDVLQE